MYCHSRLLLVSIFCIALNSEITAFSLTETIIDTLAKNYGTEPLSCEHETFVSAIVQEMGVITPIKFRYMNLKALGIFGLYNAWAYLDSYVFISKYFFEKLTKEEQRFLIGHELGHIKQHYAKINIPISIIAQVFPFVSAAGSWYLLKNHHVAIKIIASLSTFTTIGLLCNIVKAYLTRYYEYDADRKSALLLKSSQDGISYINHINNLINESALDQVNPDTLSWIKQLLITHPTNENRITQLETLLF